MSMSAPAVMARVRDIAVIAGLAFASLCGRRGREQQCGRACKGCARGEAVQAGAIGVDGEASLGHLDSFAAVSLHSIALTRARVIAPSERPFR